MQKTRYTAITYTLLHQPVPGNREIRFRPARNTAINRPKEAKIHV